MKRNPYLTIANVAKGLLCTGIFLLQNSTAYAQGSQWVIDGGGSPFGNSFIKNSATPLTLGTASFIKVGQYYTGQTYRTLFYGGNLGISQDEDTFGHFKGKWSFTGKYNKYIGSSTVYNPPATFAGFNYLINYHRWGDYAAHFGLRSATTTLSSSESGNVYTDSDLKHAVITWGYEVDSTPNRLIFQSMNGVDHQGATTVHNETEVMTILHTGHVGLGISTPLSQFVIKPISGKSYNSAISVMNSDDEVKVTIGHDGLVEVVGTPGNDIFNLFSESGINLLNVSDSTITTRAFSRFYSKGIADSVSFFGLFDQSGDTLFSMKEGGTLSLPQLATSNHQTLFLNTIGEVYAMNSSGPNPNLSWIPSGNTFGGGATSQTLGTWSNTDIDLITGGTVLGRIHGNNSAKKGQIELKKSVAIGGSSLNGFAQADTNYALTLKTPWPSTTFNANAKGIFKCIAIDSTVVLSVTNAGIAMWPNSTPNSGWLFTKGFAYTSGDILPLDTGVDDIGTNYYRYDNIYSGNTRTSNLFVDGFVQSDLTPYISATYNLGSSTKYYSGVYGPSYPPSDQRLKTNISPVSNTLGKLLLLNPVTYDYKSGLGNKPFFGFIAQEIENIFPTVVIKPNSLNGYYAINYDELIALTIKGIQEQQAIIKQQQATIDSLKEKWNLVFANNLVKESKNIQSQKETLNQLPLLFQNHPNPFNGFTFIDYFLPANTANAFLRVVDNSGKLIKAFPINQSGFGQVELDCSGLAAGTYYYSLLVNTNIVETRTMVIDGW
jgi:hypothetical protein